MASDMPELAFYYPNPVWRKSDWVKNLILFFDGIALLVPDYMRDRPFEVDPAMATGLQEQGLLTILEPESFIDKKATEALATSMTDILVSGALDGLAKEETGFRELSYSRLGYVADGGLAKMLYEQLKARGLAKPIEDGLSIPMHPMVRSLVLVLLAQILRPRGRELGLDLQPATDRPEIQKALTELLGLPPMASAGHVVSLDLTAVGVDLGPVPLDDVLTFRQEHGREYRKYARDLRRFVREIGSLAIEEQEEALRDREDEIKDAARQLGELTWKTWKRPLAFSLGVAGAAWEAGAGDIVAGLLALGAGLAVADFPKSVDAGAYSYLFAARSRLS